MSRPAPKQEKKQTARSTKTTKLSQTKSKFIDGPSPLLDKKELKNYRWIEDESARTPLRLRDRALAQFASPENLTYLKSCFTKNFPPGAIRNFLCETLQDAVLNFDRGIDILMSDDTAQRGESRAATDMWTEVRRLNREFYFDRVRFVKENAKLLEKKPGDDGIFSDNESYHMRMFIADSLRPPGLEHLNNPGPLYALEEDQQVRPEWNRKALQIPPKLAKKIAFAEKSGQRSQKEGFAPFKERLKIDPSNIIPVSHPKTTQIQILTDDDGWDDGNANRTPEEAIAEYWGEGKSDSASDIDKSKMGNVEKEGVAYGDVFAWGSQWKENGGTRFMRREGVPFWQKRSREGVDYDIEETLGTAGRELDSHVRKWSMDRLTHPRGQEYRRYGSRSG